jgi:hypothetical protein
METYQLVIHACVGGVWGGGGGRGGGLRARTLTWGAVGGLDLGWIGTICRQKCVYYNYV